MAAFNGIAIWKQHHILKIFIRKMEIAAQTKAGRLADALAQIVDHLRQKLAVVTIAVVSVRRGNNMLDAVRNRHAAHLLGDVPGLGAVVDFGKDVAMDVDHGGLLGCNLI